MHFKNTLMIYKVKLKQVPHKKSTSDINNNTSVILGQVKI